MFMTQRCGDTLLFRTPPVIAAQAAVGGKKEGEGPLAAAFDELSSDNRFGQSSWEAAEKYLQLRAARLCLQKAQLPEEKVRLVLAGDLQAQCTASGYAMRELGVPFAGVFGACSTMAETLGLELDTDDYDTLNGFLISLIDKIPGDDEVFGVKYGGYEFEVKQVEDKMIKSVKVRRLPDAEADTDTSCQQNEKMIE